MDPPKSSIYLAEPIRRYRASKKNADSSGETEWYHRIMILVKSVTPHASSLEIDGPYHDAGSPGDWGGGLLRAAAGGGLRRRARLARTDDVWWWWRRGW